MGEHDKKQDDYISRWVNSLMGLPYHKDFRGKNMTLDGHCWLWYCSALRKRFLLTERLICWVWVVRWYWQYLTVTEGGVGELVGELAGVGGLPLFVHVLLVVGASVASLHAVVLLTVVLLLFLVVDAGHVLGRPAPVFLGALWSYRVWRWVRLMLPWIGDQNERREICAALSPVPPGRASSRPGCGASSLKYEGWVVVV